MGTKVGRTVIAAVAIGMLLLIANFALSYSNTRQLRAESARVLHSNEILLALDNLLTLAKDAETGQRGYVITGRPEYLIPYRTAVESIGPQLDALGRLVAGDRSWSRCWSRCDAGSAPSSASSPSRSSCATARGST